MNWSSNKTIALIEHLALGAAGVAAAYLVQSVSGINWQSYGPFAPVVVMAITSGLTLFSKWAKEQADAPTEDDVNPPAPPVA